MSSSSKKTTTSNTQTATTGTQSGTASGTSFGASGTIAPDWITDPYQDYMAKASALAGVDPSTTVAGLNGTQTGAITAAGNLGATSSGLFGQAGALAAAGASGGPNTYAGTAPVTAATYGGVGTVPAATYGGATIAPVQTISGQSLLTNLESYISPYTNDVVKTTLANYDKQAAEQTAQMQAKAAAAGAFGGSRYGVAQGEFAADSDLNRAQTEAGLRDAAFKEGASLSNQDADRRQSADTFNAGAANTRAISQAGLDEQTGIFNTGQTNTVAEQDADRAQQLGIFNTGQVNSVADQNAARAQQVGIFNAGQNDTTAARQLQAAGLFGNLATAQGEDARANIGTALTAGGVQQTTEQNQKDAATRYLAQIGGLFGQVPSDLFTQKYQYGNTNSNTSANTSSTGTSSGTTTEKSTPSIFDTLSSLASTASSIASIIPAPVPK